MRCAPSLNAFGILGCGGEILEHLGVAVLAEHASPAFTSFLLPWHGDQIVIGVDVRLVKE